MKALITMKRVIGPMLILSALAACSGGSGEDVQQNPPPPVVDGGNTELPYSGPALSTDDVKLFKTHIWDNLRSTEQCGGCHVQDDVEPSFVRTDDINLAYAAVVSGQLVNLEAPSLSLLVTQVADGHNCWRPEASVCADIITSLIEAWALDSGAEAIQIPLTAPMEQIVGTSKSFPLDGGTFASTVHPLTVEYCSGCHSEDSATQQQPFIGSADVPVAYQAARTRINLDSAEDSRLVTRLSSEFHNCWTNCSSNADEMQAAIQAFSDAILLTEVDPELVISHAMSLPDGIVASSGGRFETNVIALYEFKQGAGSTVFDSSIVKPPLDLNITGNVEWVGSWGIRINDGKAQGSTSASRKLHTQITSTGEYSIEAWVIPDNVSQDGPARIVTYSGGSETRNFTLGQTLYDYNFLARSSESDANGMPMISTPANLEILQATLQHVVVNYDPIDGKSIYINGEWISGNPDVPGNLNDWDPTFALAVGNEADNQQLWMGTMRLLAIHNRVLDADQIRKNFEAGVGEKFFLLFGVSHLIDMEQAYIVFEVQQYDNYSYLFDKPFFISLDKTLPAPQDLVIQGLRLGVNGREVDIGQSYGNLNITINADNYDATEGVRLSELGALVPLDKGQAEDQFFLSFDSISTTSGGEETYDRPDDPSPEPPEEKPAGEQSDIGVRTFGEVNATLASITGVPETATLVADTYAIVRQQMPTVETVEGFLSSHQSGVMQLSVAYCTTLVSNTTYRDAFFPVEFDFDAGHAVAFADDNEDLIIQPLLEGLLAHDIDLGDSIASIETQPVPVDLELELTELIGHMSASDTPTSVIATCAAALGSAVMLVQ